LEEQEERAEKEEKEERIRETPGFIPVGTLPRASPPALDLLF